MKLKISQQQVLGSVFLVYTLQTDNTLMHLNEIILKIGNRVVNGSDPKSEV
jgi:hypothetical protein